MVGEMKHVFFFDMDGVLFDSMPHHAVAWSTVMTRHGFPFTERDAYLYEGRTGTSVIDEAIFDLEGRHGSKEEIDAIYAEKSALFREMGEMQPIARVQNVLAYLRSQGALIFIVTGSGQLSLMDRLDTVFPGVFCRERMVTGLDVSRCKPDPEPYLMGYAKAERLYTSIPYGLKVQKGWPAELSKDACAVVENAPLGVRSGVAAGMTVYAVNTGPLPDECLSSEGAEHVFPDMKSLLDYLRNDTNQQTLN